MMGTAGGGQVGIVPILGELSQVIADLNEDGCAGSHAVGWEELLRISPRNL